ncbi:major facilitator superfamily domain-containing protein [Podospora australis]|uniref:Major facilitator superfamily domain-containing protein n=1 Tax=Podospora australis TaxID=1536484 RepID=A0AAN6WX54_9PEZI|nr:major facilitator superfamily domain-containing protein [Podospora australis]
MPWISSFFHPARVARSGARYQPLHDAMGDDTVYQQSDDIQDAVMGNHRVVVTEGDNKRIRQKTDKVILVILVWVYFLQILDKTVLGFSAIYGLQHDTHLTGNQYSLVGAIAPLAQLIWQPFSSVLIVKVPPRMLMPLLVLGWGIAQCLMPLCRNLAHLLVDRFFLGLFEAGCLPLFSIITGQWYRRSEQPLRVAAWYGTNGLGTIAAALLSYGLGHVTNSRLASWQLIFLITGLITVITVPWIYWKLDNDISSARFLTPKERSQAQERLRANQTGAHTGKINWNHVSEIFLDVKTYLFIVMALANNLGAQVTNIFGPLILSGLGFDRYKTTLLNIPFGVVQWLIIILTAYAASKTRRKSLTLLGMLFPVLTGLVMLYLLPRGESNTTGLLLTGYYFLAFIFGGNPLIVSWILANTGGETKRAAVMSLYNAATSAGNIIGSLLFDSKDAPEYLPGLKSTMGVFAAMVAVVLLQTAILVLLNKKHSAMRVRNGKPAVMKDRSMEDEFTVDDMQEEDEAEPGRGTSLQDLTDRKNDEFVYVY